jgi:hypothetical protein
MLKFEIENSNKLDFSNDLPVFEIGKRKVYKCSFKKDSVKKYKSLNDSDLYYVTLNEEDKDDGAYILLQYDSKEKYLVLFEFIRKTKEDMESIEYIMLDLIKKLGYEPNNYSRSSLGNCYFFS